jgi:hypothetical protein
MSDTVGMTNSATCYSFLSDVNHSGASLGLNRVQLPYNLFSYALLLFI